MRTIAVIQYESRRGIELDNDQLDILSRSKALSVTPARYHPGRWDLTANRWVGVVHTQDLEVRIRPKVTIARLLFLLGYATDPTGWRDEQIDVRHDDELVPAVARSFVMQTERALRKGVLQGYRVYEEALPTIVGRIRVSDQMSRRFGLAPPVEVTYDDFTIDILENRFVLTATVLLLKLQGLDQLTRRRLRHIAARLAGVTAFDLRRVPALPAPTRLNDRYRSALALSSLVIRGTSPEIGWGTTPAMSFLFNMDKVFEDFITTALGRALQRSSGRTVGQHQGWLDSAELIEIRPDLVWIDRGSIRAIIDAKYKRIVDEVGPNADIYQMHAYLTGFGIDRGWLIYAEGEAPVASHRISDGRSQIHVITLDLDRSPGDLIDDVAKVANMITAGSVAAPRTLEDLAAAR